MIKPVFIISVPKDESIPLRVFDYRIPDTPPKISEASLALVKERIFAALLQGYVVHSEEHQSHTRIYIVSGEEMALARMSLERDLKTVRERKK